MGSYALLYGLLGLSKTSNWPAGNCEPLHRETEIADQGKKGRVGREGGREGRGPAVSDVCFAYGVPLCWPAWVLDTEIFKLLVRAKDPL